MSSQISPDHVGLALVDDDAMALAHLGGLFSDAEDLTVLTATRSPRAFSSSFSRIRLMSSSPMSTWRTWTESR